MFRRCHVSEIELQEEELPISQAKSWCLGDVVRGIEVQQEEALLTSQRES